MADFISTPIINGVRVEEFASSGTPAWHNLGTVFAPGSDAAMNSEDAGRLSNLAHWEPRTGEVYRGDGSRILGVKEVYRSDNEDHLGIVSDKYVPFGNMQAFEFLDSLTADGTMEYETAFALKGGKQIALLCRLPTVDVIGEGDVQKRYICLTNSHDGTSAIRVLPTSIRVVCWNTLSMALRGSREQTMRCSHNAGMAAREDRLREMRLYLSQFDAQFTDYCESAQKLVRASLTEAQRIEFIRKLWPVSEIDGARAQTNANNRERILSRLFREDATNNMPGMRGTWWAAFNSVTQYLDHYSNYRGENADSNRFLSITTGPAAALKAKAFSLALSAV